MRKNTGTNRVDELIAGIECLLVMESTQAGIEAEIALWRATRFASVQWAKRAGLVVRCVNPIGVNGLNAFLALPNDYPAVSIVLNAADMSFAGDFSLKAAHAGLLRCAFTDRMRAAQWVARRARALVLSRRPQVLLPELQEREPSRAQIAPRDHLFAAQGLQLKVSSLQSLSLGRRNQDALAARVQPPLR